MDAYLDHDNFLWYNGKLFDAGTLMTITADPAAQQLLLMDAQGNLGAFDRNDNIVLLLRDIKDPVEIACGDQRHNGHVICVLHGDGHLTYLVSSLSTGRYSRKTVNFRKPVIHIMHDRRQIAVITDRGEVYTAGMKYERIDFSKVYDPKIYGRALKYYELEDTKIVLTDRGQVIIKGSLNILGRPTENISSFRAIRELHDIVDIGLVEVSNNSHYHDAAVLVMLDGNGRLLFSGYNMSSSLIFGIEPTSRIRATIFYQITELNDIERVTAMNSEGGLIFVDKQNTLWSAEYGLGAFTVIRQNVDVKMFPGMLITDHHSATKSARKV